MQYSQDKENAYAGVNKIKEEPVHGVFIKEEMKEEVKQEVNEEVKDEEDVKRMSYTCGFVVTAIMGSYP